jgi:hypothetical protein
LAKTQQQMKAERAVAEGKDPASQQKDHLDAAYKSLKEQEKQTRQLEELNKKAPGWGALGA